MKMKIGMDIDGVLVDSVNGMIEIYNEKYNKNAGVEDIFCFELWECLDIHKEQAFELVDGYFDSEKYWNTLLVEGVFGALKKLSLIHELIIIISRSLRVREITIKYLLENFPGINFIVVYSGGFRNQHEKSKLDICKELGIDFFIEGNFNFIKNCDDDLRILLFDQLGNRNFDIEQKETTAFRQWSVVLKILWEFLEHSKLKVLKSSRLIFRSIS